MKGTKDKPAGTIVFDVETHSADLFWSMRPEEFVRLAGYRWKGDSKVTLTTDLEELREQILSARWIIGHNIHHFDLPAVFGVKSDIPLQLAMQKRVYDTWTHAVLVHPAPYKYVNRHGKDALGDSPEKMKAWFSLDEQAYQLGVPGKTADLKALAKEFGDAAGFKGKDSVNAGFGLIPVDDQRYEEYLEGDVNASYAIAMELLKKGPLDAYSMREQELDARMFVISANGFRVDQERAQARVNQLEVRKEDLLAELTARYGFPTEGASPWSTAAGKQAILDALADHGITPKSAPSWPRTGTGALQLGGDVLLSLTAGTPAEELGQALAELKGQRSLAQLALDSVQPDGFVHPQITMLQKSGRSSVTKPGLTIWSAREGKDEEKAYFIPDNDDHVLIGLDASNADARAVAWLSGDTEYAKRFQPGVDGHMIGALAAWGPEVVNESEESKKFYRTKGKPLSHAWAYGAGWRALVRSTGVEEESARRFEKNMNALYHRVCSWQDSVRKLATKQGYVLSQWGRKLWVEKGREYTQAPALLGQNATREVMADAILSMPIPVLRTVKAHIHDELIFSVPRDRWEACRDYLAKLMSRSYPAPRGGLPMDFPMSTDTAGNNWQEAGH